MQTYGRLDRDVLVAGAWRVGLLDLACQGLFLLLVVAKLCLDSCKARLFCPWGFSRQEYWSGLPFPSQGDLPNPGIEPMSPELQADSLLLSHRESPPRSLGPSFLSSVSLSPPSFPPRNGTYQVQTPEKVHLLDV